MVNVRSIPRMPLLLGALVALVWLVAFPVSAMAEGEVTLVEAGSETPLEYGAELELHMRSATLQNEWLGGPCEDLDMRAEYQGSSNAEESPMEAGDAQILVFGGYPEHLNCSLNGGFYVGRFGEFVYNSMTYIYGFNSLIYVHSGESVSYFWGAGLFELLNWNEQQKYAECHYSTNPEGFPATSWSSATWVNRENEGAHIAFAYHFYGDCEPLWFSGEFELTTGEDETPVRIIPAES